MALSDLFLRESEVMSFIILECICQCEKKKKRYDKNDVYLQTLIHSHAITKNNVE